ncbi:type VI secretion system membrane subunit TssM [Robbsia andropogonis]|uniref:type VI secretion system membrane subunit TssM n=1 Tax=Robbsia andropogonis TaxID=28092 RepID=UPI00209DB69F|nr:type VI secretion system membrane subunit TssM [Robbsia andropogonis]MCP1117287.1 type VI secretion system membrane subunit TssM [Robbsia andropogonis]MCP1129318.1 type VI secretion system membrane subunit TssM [Robbsia andropogonis]
MQRLLRILTHTRTLSIIGALALVGFLFLGATALRIRLVWAVAVFGMLLLLWLLIRIFKYLKAHRSGARLNKALEQQVETAQPAPGADPARQAELDGLRSRLAQAVRTIKTSKIGQMSGSRALYELPWYIVIGNPSAGKSSAILNSGLQFPLAGENSAAIHGVGGTRNCDWFFTTEGILLDTAGRYAVHEEDRSEWLGFLGLLKKYRPRAPINGIIVTASIAELTGSKPEFAIELAKNLRQRVQELTEKLEVFAPVYVMFTKADLITGFTEFFGGGDRTEFERVWGSSFPYEPSEKVDAVAQFDKRFDELHDGLKDISIAQIALSRNGTLAPGQLSFPLEFSAIKASLRSFLATLFETNPFQYQPVFRGFYFSSALQEGVANSAASERIARRFALGGNPLPNASTTLSKHGFFLRDFFSKVVFADRKTVRQYASPLKTRARYLTFFSLVTALALMLGVWTWSTLNNQQLTRNVQADLDKVARLQSEHTDLQSRLEGMDILEDRIQQLEQFRQNRPLSLSFGLYQGDRLEQRLLDEYYYGIKQLLLSPVSANLAAFLSDVNAHASDLSPLNHAPGEVNAQANAPSALQATRRNAITPNGAPPSNGLYADASPTNVQDAYNALKTYLMLGDKRHVEIAHLTDQLARFWRGWLETNRGAMPRDQMIRSAERMITFYLSRVNDDDWPMIEENLALVDQTRADLRRVVSGMPARERVYEEIKARASTRYAPMTVARILGPHDGKLVAGSYAIPGTFTREAWFDYVQPAIRDAATKELQAKDWVLDSTDSNDLTLDGSPEQIQKALVGMYKAEYARQWQQFMNGISVREFGTFVQATNALDRLGDPQDSPIRKLLETAYEQTSWDNPSLLNTGITRAKTGVINWFKNLFNSSNVPNTANIDINGKPVAMPIGPVGTAFTGLGRIVMQRQEGSMLRTYMDRLSKVRSRFNTLKNQGEPGPGAKLLMQQTLDGNGSELSDALTYVDEQMLNGLGEDQRNALRPLLVRPLQEGYAVITRATSGEINKIWAAQIYQPFQTSLATKYPFDANGKVEAAPAEIGQVFGPNGTISTFVSGTLGPLVVRRGDVLSPRTWGDMGLQLAPDFIAGFGRWVAPLAGGAASGGAAAQQPQTVFQILPEPSPGTTEYAITIDSQVLRYRNTPPQWTNFVWPNPNGQPGAQLTATSYDGRTIELFNQPGNYGLEKLLDAGHPKRKADGTFDLAWTQGNVTVTARMRIISSAQSGDSAGGKSGAGGQSLLGLTLPASIVTMPVPGARIGAPANPGSGVVSTASGSGALAAPGNGASAGGNP